MIKFLLLFVFVAYIQTTGADYSEWDQCLDGIDVMYNQYDESLKKLALQPRKVSMVYQNKELDGRQG